MAVELVLRNGTAAENDAFTGALAEVTVDKTNNTLRVHDGVTAGGTPLLTGGSSGATLTDITLAGTTSSESGSNLVFEPDTQIVEIRGDGSSVVGQLQLNCQVNTHGQIIAAQPHSENSTNVLTLPGGDTIGDADATLVSDTGTQDLSNKTLSSPTFSGQVTGDLIPSSDVTFDLGSATNRWKDLFLSGTTLDIGGATISVVGGSFEFKDSGGGDAVVSLAANTTDDLAEGTTNLYAAQPVDTTDDVTFNSVTVDGDLIVNGTSTTLNTTTLDVEDINITVANGASSATAANGAGLTIDLGTDGTADFTYDSANDRLASNKSIATDIVGDVTGTVSDISNHDTDDLSEGTSNLYYTDTRVRNAVSGTTGLDYSSATGEFSLADTTVTAGTFGSASEVPVITVDAQGRITGASTTNVAGVSSFSYDNATGDLDIGTADGSTFTATVALGPFTTDDLSEGLSNLYYTDTRVRNAVSATGDLTYDSTTGAFGVTTYKTSDFDTDFSGKTSDDLSEGTTNLYYTNARVDAHLSGGTGVTFSNGVISVGQSVETTDNVTFNNVNVSGTLSSDDISAATVTASNDLIVQGDLTVNGTTTTTNSTEINTTSATITLVDGLDENTAPSQNAGLVVNRGSSPDRTFLFDEGVDKWTLGTETLIAGTVEADVIGTVSDISNHDTDDLSEGVSNLYYTDARVRNSLSAAGDLSYNSTTGEFSVTTFKSSDFDSNFSGKSTTDLSEGTNLYYTDARVDAHLSGGSGIDFSTGTISHSDTSTVTDVTASSNTFVDALTFDGFGHVTAVSTSTAAPPNDATITVSAGTGLSGGGNFTTDQSGNETISLDVDTSTIATRSYVDTEVSNLVDSSPATLDTLNELAAALGDDPNFATTVSNDIGTKANKTTDINAGSGLTGGGDLSANRTISHADTSSQSSVNGSGNTFIQDVTLDGFGHVTSLGTATVVIPDTANDATITVSAGTGLSGGGNFTTDQATNETITVNHADTSSQGSVNNSGNTVIQDITLDGFGHITGLNSTTISSGAAEGTDVTFDSIGVGTSAPGTSGELRATGDIIAHFSDDRLKTRLGDIDNALYKIESLTGFYYEPNETAVNLGYEKTKQIGISAQDLEKVFPEAVKTAPISDEYLTVQYEKMVPVLIEAIKEQSEIINDLKNRINNLENN